MARVTEPFGEYCLCSHSREAHNLGVRDGKKIRTRCSHAACGCREHRPEDKARSQREEAK